MPNTAEKEFVEAVFAQTIDTVNIAQITKVCPASEGWGEFAAYHVQLTQGESWHLSCRVRSSSLPSETVDFLDIKKTETHSSCQHLLVVNISVGESAVLPLPNQYILANTWRSVTHVNWTDTHPFDLALQPEAQHPLPNIENPASEGGTRLSQPSGLTARQQKSPLISIITIVFNGDEYLEQTIQSVINQKSAELEYILVDGGSSDGTLAIINRYKDYIDYWISEPDKGIYDALNKGIALCRGKLIGAIHANDLYTSDAIRFLTDAHSANPESEFFYGNQYYIDSDTSWLRGRKINSTLQMVMFGNFNHPTCFINKKAYCEHGSYDLTHTIAADYDLGIRFWKAKVPFLYMDNTISYFRLGGLSGDLYRNQLQRHIIRVNNGERRIFSYLVLALVLGNYYLKAILKWWRRK